MDYSSINPATMFYAAGIVGKSDIILLLAASIYTWVLIIMGAYSIVKVSRSTQSARAAPAGGGGGK
jgi:biopolymer transport protein ExbB/TolQ